MFELADAGQPCPATMKEYTLPVVPAEAVANADAAYARGLQFAEAGRYADAAREYEIAARAGIADAADALALLYYAGAGVPQSYPYAVAFARRAADGGSAQGSFHLGLLYARGLGVAKDDGQAVIYFRRAGDGGIADAYAHLGRLYAVGTDANFEIARSWFQYAADRGSVFGAVNLGYLYEMGRGVPQDDAAAVAWFRKAAEQNDPSAMLQLGMHLRAGKGVAWNEAEAMQWFRKAADLGDSRAQTQLAYGYSQGLGKDAGQGRQDFQAAAFWYSKAAAAGDPLAQIDLGLLYQNGWGVEQNLTKARELYAQAAASDDAGAAKLARQFAASVPSEGATASDESSWVGPVVAGGLAALAVYALTRGSSGGDSNESPDSTVYENPFHDYQAGMDNITSCVVSGGHLDITGQGICFP
jgi:TPR repeat protein